MTSGSPAQRVRIDFGSSGRRIGGRERGLRTDDFYFELPEDLIAQHPVEQRDQSRLMVVNRAAGNWEHLRFRDLLDRLAPGTLLVMNDSRVIPARLRAFHPQTGGQFEILLLEETAINEWWAMMRPGKRAVPGRTVRLKQADASGPAIDATVLGVNAEGHRHLRFTGVPDVKDVLELLGEIPLPPYIRRPEGPSRAEDKSRYQTVYAQNPGSVAAPTAGLHFTPALLTDLRGRGVETATVTLHVGAGTFAPVKAENIEGHVMHSERFCVSRDAAQQIGKALHDRRPVVAVGTTSVRVLESAEEDANGGIASGWGRTNIFIYPPCRFKRVSGLITNFHLPSSTLLMLVSAFASPGDTRGRELILAAYRDAIRERYRFFSYGDAMFLS